jgi:hypothetical protein
MEKKTNVVFPLLHRSDRTQTGHILGEPRRRDNLDMQDTKNMSPVPFNLLRLFTHMAMLLGASSHPQVSTLEQGFSNVSL